MITIFWCSLIILLCIALVIIYYALTQPQSSILFSQQKTNKIWYQEALADIEAQYQAGTLTASQYEAEKMALQKNVATSFLPDVALSYKKHSLLLISVLVLFIAAAVLLYDKLGASQQLRIYYHEKQQAAQIQAEAKALGTPDKVIAALKVHLQQQPNSAQGWYLLGRLYFSQNQFDAAAKALQRAHTLSPQRADVAIQLAEASYLAKDPSLQKQAASFLQMALQLAPNDPAALNLEALMAYHHADYQKALDIWQGLLLEAPQGSSSAQAIQAAINKVETKLNQQGATASAALPVTVTLSADMAKQVAPGSSLLIYAKAVKGPPMPLAIQRLALPAFPYHTVLSDANAMMATLKLSAFDQVIIYARISKSGQAMPQAGDLEGHSTMINTKKPGQVVVQIKNIIDSSHG